jgi:plasmid rolling circle replication initiator protein Rep
MSDILQEKDFLKDKIRNLAIYDKYINWNPKKAIKLMDCGTNIWFDLKEHTQTKDRKLFLKNMYTCKDRFCPFCNTRRQKKYSKLIYKNLVQLQKTQKLRFIFLTLTIKNCKLEDLKSTIVQMKKAFNNMTKLKRWQDSILGFLNVLEFTYNQKENTYHPHFHILLAVQPKYFDTNRNLYLKNQDFKDMWKNALKVDYSIQTNVKIVSSRKINKDRDTGKEKILNKEASAVAELCKYPFKDTDISKIKETDFIELTKQLFRVHNISTGGILKNLHSKVKKIDNDLIKIDDDDVDDLWILIKEVLYKLETKEQGLNYYLQNNP